MDLTTIKITDPAHVILIKQFYQKNLNITPFAGKERAEAKRKYKDFNPTASDSKCEDAIKYLAMKIRNVVIRPDFTNKPRCQKSWRS